MSKESKKNWGKIKEEYESNERLEEEKELDEEEVEEAEVGEKALGHPSYAELEEQLTVAEKKAHENWDRAARAVAELENIRRRSEREIANAHRYGTEKLLLDCLPVMDSLEQALQLSEKENYQGMTEGLHLTAKLFLDVLQKNGVQQIDPQGQPFNPQEHEAMSIQENEEVDPNTILTVFQKGYRLHDRIIRPARVIVAKRK